MYETAHKIETYCWFGSAVLAKPCLRYLTRVGFTGATPGSPLVSLSILKITTCDSTVVITSFNICTEEKRDSFGQVGLKNEYPQLFCSLNL